jgi:hypothetical protein
MFMIDKVFMWPQANTQGDFNQKLEKKGVAFA